MTRESRPLFRWTFLYSGRNQRLAMRIHGTDPRAHNEYYFDRRHRTFWLRRHISQIIRCGFVPWLELYRKIMNYIQQSSMTSRVELEINQDVQGYEICVSISNDVLGQASIIYDALACRGAAWLEQHHLTSIHQLV